MKNLSKTTSQSGNEDIIKKMAFEAVRPWSRRFASLGLCQRRIRLSQVAGFILLPWLVSSCTVYQHKSININMAKKKKSMVTYYTKYNRFQTTTPGEKNSLPSMTEPGEGLSIKDMIRMYANGEIPQMAVEAFHGIDVDIDMYSGRYPEDITELEALRESVESSTNERTSVAKDGATKRGSVAEESKSGVLRNEEKKTSEASKVGEEPQRPPQPSVL